VDLLWGYTGLLSLGQCLYFSLGGYMMGMYLMRMIGSLGQYHMPIPDFLVFLGWTRLPPFWKPFSSFPFRPFDGRSCCRVLLARFVSASSPFAPAFAASIFRSSPRR
jgi:ABC-type branched-subunit amino acid transport system permease subunit